jgi:hypothetical protein
MKIRVLFGIAITSIIILIASVFEDLGAQASSPQTFKAFLNQYQGKRLANSQFTLSAVRNDYLFLSEIEESGKVKDQQAIPLTSIKYIYIRGDRVEIKLISER